MRARLVVATLTLALAGCGDEQDTGQSSNAPPGKVEVDQGSPPEAQLASIDEESPIVEKRLVRRYRFLLDRLEPRCREPRRRLADMAVKATQLLDREKGVKVSTRRVLEGVTRAASVGATKRCIQLFTLYVATTGEP